MEHKKDKEENKKVIKFLIILGVLYFLVLAVECIVSSWWNILLVVLIVITVIWCFYKMKKDKPFGRGVIIIILLCLLLAWSIIPCAYQNHLAWMGETERDEKQREIEGKKFAKQMEEDMKKYREESEKQQAKKEADEKNKPEPKRPAVPVYNYKDDKDCSDFNSATEATSFMKASKAAGYGEHRLDRNNDGIACN